ncbi:MAG: ABC transporter permease [Candidatus Bipolaricaulaceae bacterium]
MRRALLLFRKEILQAVRDRRTVFITVLFPLTFYPLMFALIGGLVRGEQERLAELVPRVLAVVEGEDELAGALAAASEFQVTFRQDLAAVVPALEEGRAELGLHAVPRPERGELGYQLTLYYDAADSQAQVAASMMKGFLSDYFQEVARKRLAAMGIDPAELTPPFTVEVEDIGGDQGLGGMLLARMLPYFLVLSILSGAMGFGAEITAGEKERGTLATLLASRLSRTEIVVGKFFAVLAVALTTTLLSGAGLVLGIQTFGAGLGGLSVVAAGWILILLLPLAMALSAVVLIVGSFARSQKEASAYLLPVLMIVVLLGISTMVRTAQPQGAQLAVPVAGPMAAIQRALAGSLELGELGWALLSSAALAAALLWLAVRIFRSERVLFRM